MFTNDSQLFIYKVLLKLIIEILHEHKAYAKWQHYMELDTTDQCLFWATHNVAMQFSILVEVYAHNEWGIL